MFTSLVVAVVAIGLAIGCWFRPMPGSTGSPVPSAPSYTRQQVADAKTNVCIAFGKVDRALNLADAEPVSSDRTEQLAVAALTRIAFDGGSRYLLTTLAEEQATPPELATAVRKQANSLQELLIGFLDGVPNSDPEQQPAVNASNEAAAKIRRLCK